LILASLRRHILTHLLCSDEENEDEDEDDDEKFFSAEEGDFEGEGFESYLAKGRGSRGRSGMAREGDRDSSSDSESRRSESKVAKVITPFELETPLLR
jgi:hypothetical protein